MGKWKSHIWIKILLANAKGGIEDGLCTGNGKWNRKIEIGSDNMDGYSILFRNCLVEAKNAYCNIKKTSIR